MPTLDLEFEVYCSCGTGLCNNSTEGKNRHSSYITIEPCETCAKASYEEGFDAGYEQCLADNKL